MQKTFCDVCSEEIHEEENSNCGEFINSHGYIVGQVKAILVTSPGERSWAFKTVTHVCFTCRIEALAKAYTQMLRQTGKKARLTIKKIGPLASDEVNA